MKKLVYVSLLSAVCVSGLAAEEVKKAVEPKPIVSSKGSLKVGVVSAMEVGTAAESQALQQEIMKIRNKYEGSIKKVDEEIQKLAVDLQNAAQAKLKGKVDELQEKLTQKQQERELAAKNAERNMQRDAEKVIRESQEHFMDAINNVAKQQGLDLVLQREAILYVKDGSDLNITKEVVAQWDKDYTAKTKKAAAPAPAVKK